MEKEILHEQIQKGSMAELALRNVLGSFFLDQQSRICTEAIFAFRKCELNETKAISFIAELSAVDRLKAHIDGMIRNKNVAEIKLEGTNR